MAAQDDLAEGAGTAVQDGGHFRDKAVGHVVILVGRSGGFEADAVDVREVAVKLVTCGACHGQWRRPDRNLG
ncbi:hypothetical protein GCM10010431_44540 [Streptomyces kunmingensis]